MIFSLITGVAIKIDRIQIKLEHLLVVSFILSLVDISETIENYYLTG